MAIAFVQVTSGSGSGSSLAVAFGSNNASGNFLVVGVNAESAASADVVTDSRNTYVNDVAFVSNGTNGCSEWAAMNCGAGANTVTVTGGGTHARTLSLAEYSGVALTSALDKIKTASGFSQAPSSGAAAATTQADELLVGVIGWGSSTALPATPGSGWTERQEIDGTIDGYYEDQIVSATGAYTANCTTSSGNKDWVALLATYKMATPAPFISYGNPLDQRNLRPSIFVPMGPGTSR